MVSGEMSAPASLPGNAPPPRMSRLRLAVVVVFALLSLPGLFFSALAMAGALSTLLAGPQPYSDLLVWGGLGVALSWISISVLAVAWVRLRTGHRAWAVLGLLSGLPCALLYIPFSITLLPALGFGIYLAMDSLRAPRRRETP